MAPFDSDSLRERPVNARGDRWPTPEGWSVSHIVFDDAPGGIGVALLTNGQRTMLGLRWHEGRDTVEPWPADATGYFLLPFTFAAAIARSLLTMKACGSVSGFNEAGVTALVHWLAELQAVDDALCY
jgi:hypothetical protein